jgi:hypothetical protein
VFGKGVSVLKIQALLLQVKLSSALYCLKQLIESLVILVSSPRVLDKGALVLKIQVFLLQVKLSSTLYYLKQLVESLEIQTSATQYIVNFSESD